MGMIHSFHKGPTPTPQKQEGKLLAGRLVSLRWGCWWRDYILGSKSFPGAIATPSPPNSLKRRENCFSYSWALPTLTQHRGLGDLGLDEQCSRAATRGRTAPTNPAHVPLWTEGGRTVLGPLLGQEVPRSVASCPWAGDTLDSQSRGCPSWKRLRKDLFTEVRNPESRRHPPWSQDRAGQNRTGTPRLSAPSTCTYSFSPSPLRVRPRQRPGTKTKWNCGEGATTSPPSPVFPGCRGTER